MPVQTVAVARCDEVPEGKVKVVEVNGVRVNARDGAAISDEAKVKITALEDSELVLVDAA